MPDQRRRILSGALIGLAVTAPLVALLYLGWQIAGLPMVAFDLTERITRLEQLGGLVTKAIELMVSLFSGLPGVSTDVAAKSAEQLSGVVLFLVIGAILGALFGALHQRLGSRAGLIFGIGAGLLSVLVEILSRAPEPLMVVLWLGVLSLGWGYALAYVFDKVFVPAAMRPSVVEEASRSRRQFLIQFGGTVLAVTLGAWGLGALIGRRGVSEAAGKPIGTPEAATPAATAAEVAAGPSTAFVPAPGTRPEVTANADFYRVDNNIAGPPSIDEKTWNLKVLGLVNTALSLSYDDIRKMTPVQQDATLECISNEVGGDLISSTRWTGVRLRDVLNQAGLKEGVVEIKFTCADDYTESLPLESAMDERTLLVYAMNGEALTEAHGFPLRLYTPNRYGMKNPKWLTQIEAISSPYDGYWEVRGWDKQAIVKTTSVIDTIAADQAQNGVVPVGGIAFSGARGISKVEVSADGGPWQEAKLKDPISPLTWRLWRLDWKASPGRHELRVRATDGQGAPQIETVAPLHPDGASGLHSKSVDIG